MREFGEVAKLLDALVLAGGKGTRLQSIVSDRPTKSMAKGLSH